MTTPETQPIHHAQIAVETSRSIVRATTLLLEEAAQTHGAAKRRNAEMRKSLKAWRAQR